MSVGKAGSKGWTVFHGRRIVLGVSSPDCKQNRTSLVRAGRQGMCVVTAGSEGVADESSPDCHHHTLLYFNDYVLQCAYNQPVLPEDALCARANPEQTAKRKHALYRNPGNQG